MDEVDGVDEGGGITIRPLLSSTSSTPSTFVIIVIVLSFSNCFFKIFMLQLEKSVMCFNYKNRVILLLEVLFYQGRGRDIV